VCVLGQTAEYGDVVLRTWPEGVAAIVIVNALALVPDVATIVIRAARAKLSSSRCR